MRPLTSSVVAITLLFPWAPLFSEDYRHALVIGNGDYLHTRKLHNPKNDAQEVSEGLRKIGFHVTERVDADLRTMKSGVREFLDTLSKQNSEKKVVALIYFAGHGVQIDGQNYLIPVDAEMARDFEVPDETMPLDGMIRGLDSAQVDLGILILDCCRDNPFARSWRGGRSLSQAGLAVPLGAPRGTFISFATSPGEVAADGEGDNSPFTEAFLRHLGTPSKGFEDIFKAVGRDVALATNGRQEPWFNSKFYGEFSFVPEGGEIVPPAPAPVMPESRPTAGKDAAEASKGRRLEGPSPEVVRKREKEMIEAISAYSPRSLIIRLAESDPSEQLRFQACSQLVEMKDPGAQNKLHKLFSEIADPDLKSNIAKVLWWEFSDKTHADFLYQDYMNRGHTGPVLNWGFWVPALVEMKHQKAMSTFRQRFLNDYNAASNAGIRHTMILKMGLPMAAYDKNLVATIRSRVKALPKGSSDLAVYFGLAALGDEYAISRVKSALDEPLGEYDNPLVYSIHTSKKSYSQYEHLFGYGTMDVEGTGVVSHALKRLQEFRNPSQCLEGVYLIAAQGETFGFEMPSRFASLEIQFPETLFEKEAKRDPRIPEGGEDSAEAESHGFLSNIGKPLSDEAQFDKSAPGLAVQGNPGVVSFASRWFESPNPSMRFRAAQLVNFFTGSEKAEAQPENWKELQSSAARILVEMYDEAPLKVVESEFGDYPGKMDILFALESLDPESCLELCSGFIESLETGPEIVVSETVVYDGAEKRLTVRKAAEDDGYFYDREGLSWETKHKVEREWLIFDVLSLYIRLTELRDEDFLEKVGSFAFQQPIASRGARMNKEMGPLGSRKIDSVAEVSARINKILFTSGGLHVYPQIVKDSQSSDDDARTEALEVLVLAAEKF